MKSNSLRSILCVVILLFSALLASCGDDVRVVESDKQVITQAIYVTPEKFTGAVHIFYAPQKNIFLELNENVKFTVEYSLGDKILDADQAVNYYKSVLWKINGEKFNISSFRYTFRDPGKNICTLQTIDIFGDTLLDTINVHVNTPTHIHLTYPRDKYNQLNIALKDTINLNWDIQGLDPWETAKCRIFNYTEKELLWRNPKTEVNCNEQVIFAIDSVDKILKEITTDFSQTFYWGVILTVFNEQGISEIDTSEIFSFTTMILDSTQSLLQIPIVYEKMSLFDYPDTRILVINSKGDTIAEEYSGNREDYVTLHIEPQTNVKVHLENTIQTEFKTTDFTIDIPKQTNVIADTVFFKDKTAPIVWPINTTRTLDSYFKFAILDKGSGINSNKIQIYKNELDEIEGSFNDTLLTIPNIRDASYTLSITVYDKAGNKNTPVYWKVRTEQITEASVYNGNEDGIVQILTGPFSNREDAE